jgi:hypothetical protein
VLAPTLRITHSRRHTLIGVINRFLLRLLQRGGFYQSALTRVAPARPAEPDDYGALARSTLSGAWRLQYPPKVGIGVQLDPRTPSNGASKLIWPCTEL